MRRLTNMEKRIFGGGVALFLLGASLGWGLGRPNAASQIELAAIRNQEAHMTALSEALVAIDARLEEVGTVTVARFDETSQATGRLEQAATALAERLDGLAIEIVRRIDGLEQSAASAEQVQQE